MMKYESKLMDDGTLEVLQSDGGEEILGRLTFRDVREFVRFLTWIDRECEYIDYIDYDHPGGKYLSANEPLSPRDET